MQNITTMNTQTSVAAILHVWRTAADMVATDPNTGRQQAYENAIARLRAEMPNYTQLNDLLDQYWSAELMAIAAVNSLRQSGHMLNYQVIAAAACWRHLQQLLSTGAITGVDGTANGE